jgi:hypothetical protein
MYINSLLAEFPKDKVVAQQNGADLGTHLARDLLSHNGTQTALQFIDPGLNSRETSTGFQFALAEVAELKNRFDLLSPLT